MGQWGHSISVDPAQNSDRILQQVRKAEWRESALIRIGNMARLARVEVFAADDIAVVHVMTRTVRRCFLLGDDALTDS